MYVDVVIWSVRICCFCMPKSVRQIEVKYFTSNTSARWSPGVSFTYRTVCLSLVLCVIFLGIAVTFHVIEKNSYITNTVYDNLLINLNNEE